MYFDALHDRGQVFRDSQKRPPNLSNNEVISALNNDFVYLHIF